MGWFLRICIGKGSDRNAILPNFLVRHAKRRCEKPRRLCHVKDGKRRNMEDKHDWIEMTRLGADEKDEFTGKLHWDQEEILSLYSALSLAYWALTWRR